MKHLQTIGFHNIVLFAAALLIGACGPKPDGHAPFDHQHALFNEVLQKHVKDRAVDYKALKSDHAGLDTYLASLAGVTQSQYEVWTRQQRLAFWINAYNAFTLKTILNHYPIGRCRLADPRQNYPTSSIRQIPGVWKLRWWRVAGHYYTLDHMEHVIMRREIAEPRIHFVLVCASIGCPWLENRAFTATTLEQRLDQAGVDYLYRSGRVNIDKDNGVVGLPQIYNWFNEDFKPLPESAAFFTDRPFKIAGPLTWIYRYASEEDRAFLRIGAYRVEYLFYDWGLNEQQA
jgi:hypothetical protein